MKLAAAAWTLLKHWQTALGRDVEQEPFWEQVATNLAAGRLRLVFVADVIPAELRAIVEFLNEQMSPTDVLAVEVRQYVDDSGEHQTLVPRLIGETQAARRAKGRSERTTWSHDSWLAAYRDSRGDREAALVESILAWAMQHDPPLEVGFGRAASDPGAMVRVPDIATLFGLYRSGRVEVHFSYIQRLPPFDLLAERRRIKDRLEGIAGIRIDERQLDKFPSFSVSTLLQAGGRDSFVDTMEWVLDEAKRAGEVGS